MKTLEHPQPDTRNSHTTWLIAITLGAVLLSTPAKESNAGEPGDTYQLRMEESIEIESRDADGPELTLHWVELNESRCPKDVQCIVAGQAELRIEAEAAGKDAEEIILILAAGRPLGDAEARVGPFHIELLAVDPYPEAGRRPDDDERSATLAVKRLPETGSE